MIPRHTLRFYARNCYRRPSFSNALAYPLLAHNRYISRNMSGKRSEEEWRAVLTPEQFRILRQGGTEMPGSGEYNHHKEQGVYCCAGCEAPLYKSATKFDSGCGWPAFYDAIPGAITRLEDSSLGMVRTEIRCANCNGHLGHVFKGERFNTPTDERHCVNSVSMKFHNENE
ncbi:Mss4-like protein [Syncephalis plumigaleata]|nr:Mss4-like protein [Syncephalis plumigaleata]